VTEEKLVHQVLTDFRKACYCVRREILVELRVYYR
jgi:hypothetical protein